MFDFINLGIILDEIVKTNTYLKEHNSMYIQAKSDRGHTLDSPNRKRVEWVDCIYFLF